MRATSLIQAMVQGTDGKIFLESFEGLNWGADQQWSTTQGNPQTSQQTAEDGLKSLIMDSSFPQTENDRSSTPFDYMTGYFFDDHTETASAFMPFLEAIRTPGTTVWGLGVDNATSTTKYTYINAGAKVASSVTRTTGWHRFSFRRETTDYVLKIDGVTVATVASGSLPWEKVRVGSTNATGTTFGFFDFIQVGKDQHITFRGLSAGQKLSLFLEDGTQIGTTVTVTGTTAQVDVSGEDVINQILPVFVKLTRTDGTNPRFLSGILRAWAGDVWTLYVVDFGRKVGALDPRRNVRREDEESNSGKDQSITFNAKERVTIITNDITDAQRRQILAWWSHAQLGKSYSVAIDSNNMYNGVLTVAAAPGDTTVTVDDPGGAAAGAAVVLRRTDNLKAEEKVIQSVAGSVITFTDPVIYEYEIGDLVRSNRYWPVARANDKQADVGLSNLKLNRWSFLHSFREVI